MFYRGVFQAQMENNEKRTFSCKYCGLTKQEPVYCKECFHTIFGKWTETDTRHTNDLAIKTMLKDILESIAELKQAFNEIKGVKKVKSFIPLEVYP
jgi:hypothetical protein